jgi:hypothetical protein
MIKILWATKNTSRIASSRIRAYALHYVLCKNFYFKNKCQSFLYRYNRSINFKDKKDVLIIQNITSFNEEILEFIKQKNKTLIIFDSCDLIHQKPFFKKIINYIDVITTNTIFNKNHIDNLNYNKPCYLLEDCIDYFPQKFYKPTSKDHKLCWFGYSKWIPNLKWVLDYLHNTKYQVNIITGRNVRKIKYIKNYSNISVSSWDIKNFVKNLRKSNISYISHKKTGRFDMRCKSNNKMISTIIYGIPCLINNSRECEKLAKQFNLDFSIINNEQELERALDYLNFYENRKKYLKNIQPYIWEKYHPEIIVKKLWKIIENHL